jgi:ACR3 family arsenite transporter
MILLRFAARHGRAILIAGLVAGIALPGLAFAMRPWIPELVAAMLFVAALRIGPRAAFGAARDFGAAVGIAGLYQVVFPLVAILIFMAFGWSGVFATAIILMLAASPISGSPNITLMTGNDPAPALRQLVIGTALLPLTVIPVFWLTPDLGNLADVFAAAARLLALILAATGLGFALRATILRAPAPVTLVAIDGASAVLMGVVVIGLMSAVGPAIFDDPAALALALVVVFAANFGLQIAAATALRATHRRHLAAPLGIVAGNRNIALFIAALPETVTDPLLLFIGCYQIPMYLTPILLGRFYRDDTAT